MTDLGDSYLGFGRPMPLGIDDADFRLRQRRVDLLRAIGLSFRYRKHGELPPWFEKDGDEEKTEGRAALRIIAAGFAVFADEVEADDPLAFRKDDWALFSGLDPERNKADHQSEFVRIAGDYLDDIWVYEQIGTSGLPDKDGGDYEFVLRDMIALLYTFKDHPHLLTNCMIRKLIGQDQVKFSSPDPGCNGLVGTAEGVVPFSGQNLDEWLAEGPDGKHFFEYTYYVPYPFFFPPVPGEQNIKMSTPETENHLLGIYVWRYMVNEYLEYVTRLPLLHERRDPCLVALVESDPQRYLNRPEIRDFVLQLLGRIPHIGSFEANARPYHSITVQAVMTFLAAGTLFGDDPERQKVVTAARNALDYFAAEFTFQSLEGKRIPPSRRQYKKRDRLGLYESDYLANIFGVLTGAYVYSDENGASDLPTGDEPFEPGGFNEPLWALKYHWHNVGDHAGYALWSLLSGYRVPKAVHGFMLNKHAGYAARIQNRATSETYPLHVRWEFGLLGFTEADDPPFARPRYFADVASGSVPPEQYDVADGGSFLPVSQLYFATPEYLNSAGGYAERYYPDATDFPGWLEEAFAEDAIHSYDVLSRPSVLLPRGNLQLREEVFLGTAALSRTVPLMQGQGEGPFEPGNFAFSENLATYKSLTVGYHFTGHDQERHQQFPQHYPEAWNEAIAREVGVGRALFRVYDFTRLPEHPLTGHYLILGRFSKSEDDGLYRSYARGLWEVVPGHRFADGHALAQHVEDSNPPEFFNNGTGEDDNYRYRMASTGETVMIDKLLGSSKTEQTILRIWAADGTDIPLNQYLMDMRDREELRLLPLMDVWQVDRDYGFTGEKYAHADGHGRVTVHNPFVGETLVIDSSDYRSPFNEVRPAQVRRAPLPRIPGTEGQSPQVLGLAVDDDRVYATHSAVPERNPVPTVPGEVVALDRRTLQVTGRVTVGRTPHRLALNPDTNRLYAVNYHDVTVTVIDTDHLSVVTTLTFPGFAITGAAVSRRFDRLFLAQPGQDRLLIVDGASNTPLAPMTGLKPTGDLAVDDAADRLFVLVEHAQNPKWQDLVEYQITATGQHELRRITVDAQVSVVSALAVDPQRVYVLNKGPGGGGGNGQKVTVVDRATFTLAGPIALPQMGLAVAASSSQRVVYVGTSSEVLTFDAVHLQPLGRTPLPAGQLKVSLGLHDPSGAIYFSGTRNGAVSAPQPPWMGH